MRGLTLIAAASALCLASTAQARMPIFIELDGVKGESTKKRSSSQSGSQSAAQAQHQAVLTPRKCGDCGIKHAAGNEPGANQTPGGVNVATKDIDGDGRPQAALLLPAVQKVRAADAGADPATATSTQGPYKLVSPRGSQSAPSKPKPKPKPKPSDSGDGTPPPETISLN